MKFKKSRIIALALSLSLAATATLAAAPAMTSEVVAAEKEYKQSTTVSYDLNHDGSPDKVEFVVIPDESGNPEYPNSGLYVNVNDNLTSAVVGDWFYSYAYEFFDIQGKTFLFIKVTGDSDDGARQIFSWEGNDFKFQREINRDFKEYEGVSYHLDASVGKVSGDTLTMNVSAQFTGLGHANVRAQYKLKNGKLTDNDATYNVIPKYHYWNKKTGEGGERNYLKVKKTIQLYKDKKCKKKAGTLDLGKKIKVTKIYIGKNYSSYYVKGLGWYKAKNNGQMAEDYFDGPMFVG